MRVVLVVERSGALTPRVNLPCSFIHLPPNTKANRVTHQPCRIFSWSSVQRMKRKAAESHIEPKVKRQKEPEADYCDAEPQKDGHENAIWPASEQSIKHARDFLKKWWVFSRQIRSGFLIG